MKITNGWVKSLLLVVSLVSVTAGRLSAQVINEGFEEPIWSSFYTGSGSSINGAVILPNVPTTSTMSYYTSRASYTTAINTCNNAGVWYYSKAFPATASGIGGVTGGVHSATHIVKVSSGGYIITPVTPSAVVNITFWATSMNGSFIAGLATNTNAAIPSYSIGASVAPGAFTYASSSYPQGTNMMQSFSFGGTFSGPCRFGIFSPNSSISIDDITIYQPTGTPPTVTTDSLSAAITHAIVGGTVTAGTLPLLASGIIWSKTPLTGSISDTLQPKIEAIPAVQSSFTDTASPLSPATTYYAEAYVVGLDGSFYVGRTLTFKTNPQTKPVVTTLDATNILSVKAAVAGNIIDSGGAAIVQKGVCWSPTQGAETILSGSDFTNEGTGGTFFTSLIVSLHPSTTYYAKAYAKNNLGISYGNEISFTTSPVVPVITTFPSNLSFGPIVLNGQAELAFVLSANALMPLVGTITVTPPAGFSISTSVSSGFVTAPATLSIPYVNGSLKKKVIYVKQISSEYGIFSGNLLLSGGSAENPNIDTVALSGSIFQDPTVTSNLGTDFWVGYGLEERMSHVIGSPQSYGLQLYVATGGQPSTIKVSIPGIPSFAPLEYTIPANSVQVVSGFPIGDGSAANITGLPDCRLYYTGISNRGIHVESSNGVPVAVFLYDYATNNSAGGSMVLPTNAWNSTYMVQTYGGAGSNTGVPNSYFFVIAKEDNTVVTFKPTNAIIDSLSSPVVSGVNAYGGNTAYAANATYQVILNKGQVFNALGLTNAGTKTSYDLTGTTVSSDCNHPIAVFAGNARTLINAPVLNCTPIAGSDNLIQQMFPKVAWGTKYLTVPTKTMEYNLFRIAVQDTNTVVKVDDTVLTKAAFNSTGMYYEVEGNKGKKIESDIPVSVTQFILPGNACGSLTIGNNGTGDPEMILLSPLQQAIKSATVYASDFKNGITTGGAFINVVIPHSGVASFRLDSTAMVDTGRNSFVLDTTVGSAYGASPLIPIANAFSPFPQDTSYYWAKFHVSYPAVHTLSSDVGFNAIAYGVASGESWGYNAGTAIRDLSAIKIVKNPFGTDTSSTVVRTCKNNPVTLKVALPYLPEQVDSIVWTAPDNESINLSGSSYTGPIRTDSINVNKHYADTSGSVVVDGQTFYIYTCPVQYQFSNYGIYPMVVTAHGTFLAGCGGMDAKKVYVLVGGDYINFKATPAGCGSTKVVFADSSAAVTGGSIVKWIWDLGDGTTDSSTNASDHNPTINPHTYPALNSYWAKLTTINSYGCFSKDSVKVDLTFGINALFGKDKDSICPNSTISFYDSSSNAVSWKWDFGDVGSGVDNTSTLQNPTHSYADSGSHVVSLQVFSASSCPSIVANDKVYVAGLPKALFGAPSAIKSLPDTIAFVNQCDTATGDNLTYLWSFGDGSTSTSKNPVHVYTSAPPVSGDTVRLTVTTSLGCSEEAILVLKDSTTALPLSLTALKAIVNGSAVKLNWHTSTELNTDHFIIQHSTDGSSFTIVGTQKAIGNEANSYIFTDNKPTNGTNYYRLESVDKDWASTFSKVVSVQLTIDNYQLSIIPNPARDIVTVKGSHIATIQVIDNLGRVVKTVSLKDANNPTLSVGGLQAGVYHLRVQTTDGKVSGVGMVKE